MTYQRHLLKCFYQKNTIIYEENNIKIYKFDGKTDTSFCRNLCILSKCFLDHKTVYYDVEPFIFYVLYVDDKIAGYFSKERYDILLNLSCIVVFPDFRKLKLGYLLVDLSYNIFKENKGIYGIKNLKIGTCEKPLSVSGSVLYTKYWSSKVLSLLKELNCKKIRIIDICNYLGMTEDDVVFVLEHLKFLKNDGKKYFIEVNNVKTSEIRECKKELIRE